MPAPFGMLICLPILFDIWMSGVFIPMLSFGPMGPLTFVEKKLP